MNEEFKHMGTIHPTRSNALARGPRGNVGTHPTCLFLHADRYYSRNYVRHPITRVPALTTVVLGGAGIMQTIPSLALLGFMIPIFGIGVTTAIAALFLYSLLPIIRNTYTGIKDVDKATIEAAKGMGMTRRQVLLKVELPLAIPMIMAGVRTAAVINVGTATLAAFIGAGGLGDFIFLGITRGIDGLILLGAIPAALLAVVLEVIFSSLERWSTPKGLR